MSDSTNSTTPAAAGKSDEAGTTTATTAPGKPAKPRPGFPLTAHPSGVWCKKIRGKLYYFGPWDDPQGAETRYNQQKDDLHAGRTPRPTADPNAVTVKDVVNKWLNAKRNKVEAGELSVRTFGKYKEVADLLVQEFGKRRLVSDLRPDDFTALKKKMTKRWGPLRVADFIQHIRSIFKHAVDADLIERSVRFGPGFERPSAKVMRLHRAAKGPKLFTAEEVRRLIEAADVQTKAHVLLGSNCGFGNADVAVLPLVALDLDAGMIDFPRPKTGIPRRCPLWPETVAAIRAALTKRPEPKGEGDAPLAFLSERGTPICSVREANRTDGLAVQFGKLLRSLKINGRKGLGFYTLRHVFRTIADAAKDQPAADFIMGHEVAHMSSVYRETISDERLKAVSDHVRAWLFPPAKDNTKPVATQQVEAAPSAVDQNDRE